MLFIINILVPVLLLEQYSFQRLLFSTLLLSHPMSRLEQSNSFKKPLEKLTEIVLLFENTQNSPLLKLSDQHKAIINAQRYRWGPKQFTFGYQSWYENNWWDICAENGQKAVKICSSPIRGSKSFFLTMYLLVFKLNKGNKIVQ